MERYRYLPSFARFLSQSGAALAIAFLLFVPRQICAQLNQNLLVVYNAANAASTDVANYYIAKRGIPANNVCAISPPSTTVLSWTAFDTSVKTPIKNCLNSRANGNIYYIVFAYNTPYIVTAPSGLPYSLDSFIADIWDWYVPPNQFGVPIVPQPYYAEAQSQGNVYVPFQSLKDYRGSIIYSVWRLDAATPALAKGLVDKALLAESTGLSGQVCIDEAIATTTSDYGTTGSPDWDLRQAATLATLAGFPVLQDFNTAEFGTSPAPLRCDNAALYAGLYSLNHYNNAFSWNPGAIGFHLDSGSAADPRGGTNWSANAVINGITVTGGTMTEPLLGGLIHPDGLFRTLFEGANVGDAVLRNTKWLKWTILNIGDPLYRPFPAGFPAVTAPQNSLALSPQYLVGGQPSTGTITLAAPAPSGGITVALKSSVTAVATVPPTVVVPEGQTTASFPISTKLVTVDTNSTITAIFGTTTLTNSLIVQPLLAGLLVSPISLIGGGTFTGVVTLNAPAPSGGVVVYLSSANSVVTTPVSVNVPQGATVSSQFALTSSPVTVQTVAAISATYAGAKKTISVTVKPLTLVLTLSPTAVIGGASTTANKITLNGAAPSDVVVSLSANDASVTPPPSVTVPAGQTVSPLFTIATSAVPSARIVAIAASNGGAMTSANLTVNPITPLSVTLSPTSLIGGSSSTLNKVTLNAPAPPGDAIVALSSNDASVTVPASVTVTAGSTVSAAFAITTSVVAAQKVVPISGTYNGVVKSANLTVNPLIPLLVSLSPTSVVGGVSTTANRITLNGPAPPGDAVVTLTSGDPSAAVPASVTVPAGTTLSPYFTITTSAVATPAVAAITATYNGGMKSANLTVNPVALLSVTLSPTAVVGGVSTTANRVTLNGPAPPGGVTVTLASGNPSAVAPASVIVPAGATLSPYFTIATSAVGTPTVVSITATYNGVMKSANLTLNP